MKELKVPIRRIAAPDIPIPFSEPFESAVIPFVDSIYKAAKQLLNSR